MPVDFGRPGQRLGQKMNRRKTATETPRARCSEELDSTVHRLSVYPTAIARGRCEPATMEPEAVNNSPAGTSSGMSYILLRIPGEINPKSEPGQIPTIRNVGFVRVFHSGWSISSPGRSSGARHTSMMTLPEASGFPGSSFRRWRGRTPGCRPGWPGRGCG